MVSIIESMLVAAHQNSRKNRQLLAAGGRCGCFHCQKTFDAEQVAQWVGKADDTALCPFCHYDTVLSAKVDPVDASFLRRMHDRWFEGQTTRLDLGAGFAEPEAAR